MQDASHDPSLSRVQDSTAWWYVPLAAVVRVMAGQRDRAIWPLQAASLLALCETAGAAAAGKRQATQMMCACVCGCVGVGGLRLQACRLRARPQADGETKETCRLAAGGSAAGNGPGSCHPSAPARSGATTSTGNQRAATVPQQYVAHESNSPAAAHTSGPLSNPSNAAATSWATIPPPQLPKHLAPCVIFPERLCHRVRPTCATGYGLLAKAATHPLPVGRPQRGGPLHRVHVHGCQPARQLQHLGRQALGGGLNLRHGGYGAGGLQVPAGRV